MGHLLFLLSRLPRKLKAHARALLRGQIGLSQFRILANQRGSFSITEAFVQQYHAMLLAQYQQEKSRLEMLLNPMYVHRGVTGKRDSFDRLGAAEATDITTRHGDTTYLNPAHTRRWANLVSSDGAVLIDRADRVRTLIDPQNGYRSTVVGALGRRADRHIINAAVGTATTGEEAGSTQALPSAQLIAIGSSPADLLTLAKVKSAAALLDKAGVPQGAANRLFLYSPGQTSALLAITQAASSDFTKNKIYDAGSMDGIEWMGFLWVLIPDVLDPDSTVLNRMLPLTSTTRTCIAMSRMAVGLGVGEEIQSFIDVLPQKRHATQVRSEMDMGAVRVWDNHVVSVAALEE